jgi:hypothetical protein
MGSLNIIISQVFRMLAHELREPDVLLRPCLNSKGCGTWMGVHMGCRRIAKLSACTPNPSFEKAVISSWARFYRRTIYTPFAAFVCAKDGVAPGSCDPSTRAPSFLPIDQAREESYTMFNGEDS